jgi:hypothetical protein
MKNTIRSAVLILFSMICLAASSAKAEEPMIIEIQFFTDPPHAAVKLRSDRLHSIGRSNSKAPIPLDRAPYRKSGSFDVQFELWGYHNKTENVKTFSTRWPVNGSIRLDPEIPVIIPLIYMVKNNIPATSVFAAAVFAFIFFILIPKRRKVRAALDRAARWETVRTRMGDADPYVGLKLGDYRLIEKIGAGGMGAVYRAVPDETLNDGESVAIKFMKPEVTEDEEFVRRFRREVEVTRTLDHPFILRIINWGEEDRRMYMVMELIRGTTLKDKISRGGMSLESFREYYFPVLEALEYAHGKDIIHRDIKPDNIMLTEKGRIKVMDFGLAKGNQYSTITVSGSAIGTPAYMAPEQITGKPQDSRSDQYSLGVLAWEMLAGRRPFEDESTINIVLKHLSEEPPSLKEARPDLPDGLNAIIMRMLEKAPDSRFRTLQEVKSAMEQVITSASRG